MNERLVSKEKLELALKIISTTPKELVEDIYLKNAKLGQLEDIEEELGIDLINDKERMIFIKAILKGYIYFKDHENKVHKGFIVGYEENFAFYKRKLIVAYGIGLHFNWRDDLWIYDDEELMKNPYNHPLGNRAYGSCLIKKEYGLDFENYGKTWALTKEELK